MNNLQKQAIKDKCPHCEIGNLHPVETSLEELEETLLYCNHCLLAMDSDGGYTY